MKKTTFKVFTFFLCISMLLVLFTGCNKKKEEDVIPPSPPIKQEAYVSYKNFDKAETFGLKSLQIPDTWYMEEYKNGFLLIENRTGTEINLVVEKYNPHIHNVNIDSARASLTSDTKQFLAFQKPAGNYLFFKYMMKSGTLQYVVCESQKFNYQNMFTLRFICEEKHYETYFPVFETVSESLVLPDNQITVPAGYNGMYHKDVKLLTVYPRDWKTTVQGNSYSTSYSGTSITVTINTTIQNFSGIDKTTYTSIMQKSIPNFSTSSFAIQGNCIKAEGYVTDKSIKYLINNTILNFKDYSLNIVYVAPENEYSAFFHVYTTIVDHKTTQ